MPTFRAALVSLRQGSFGRLAGEEDAWALGNARVTIFGELHQLPPCIELQHRTARAMLDAAAPDSMLHIVLEHLNFEQQNLLDEYAAGRSTLAQLVAAHEAGGEGHDLTAYEPVLRLALEQPNRVALHAGFIPRSYARIVMRESLDAALEAAKAKGYVASAESCAATEAHYSFFESLLSGRAYHDHSRPPADTYRKMFPAQVIKDAAMAHKSSTILSACRPQDKLLVICGIGHSGYGHGVPERILATHPHLEHEMYRIWSLPVDVETDLDDPASVSAAMVSAFGPAAATDPADLCLAFQERSDAASTREEGAADSAGDEAADAEAIKRATAAAYNRVGASAHLRGNLQRATAMLRRMGYNEAEVSVAGEDAPNWQGVGCPHRLAQLRPGERVVDLGSGLGIDSFIAASAVGPSGFVTGVDLAEREVFHASERARVRGLSERVSFAVADLESLPLPAASVDAVISNGAFCLAPSKAMAFAEAHRVLKVGGRLAVCLSVLRRRELQPGVAWPLCMRTFLPLDDLHSTCEAAGFGRIEIDSSDSLMAFDLPEDAAASNAAASQTPAEREERARHQVHVGSKEFDHLRDYDMNELCARVVVTAVKT